MRSCPECGTPLLAEARRGVCPRCLMRRMLELVPAEQETPETPGDSIHLVLPDGETTPLPFRELGDYELLEPLGHGGMGVIFKARQRSLDRLVALKLIRAGTLAREKDIARFRTEASAAGRLQHPNIVAIYEVAERGGQHFYSMEYVPGRSLSQALQEGPFAPRRAAELVRTIAEAIHFAHERGVLHRDLKPSNILLDTQEEPRVADFGLTKILQSDSELTMSGAVIGSPHYMPPEQARGDGAAASARSDVYSLGAILYELITGRPPFAAATPLETLKLVVEQEPISPRALNPALPRDIETICLKCLAKAPAARYGTARDLAEELARVLRGEPIQARPVTPAERAWRWCRRKPALAALGVLGIIAPLIIITVLSISRGRIRAAADLAEKERERTRENLYAADIYIAHGAVEAGNFGLASQALSKHRSGAEELHTAWRSGSGQSDIGRSAGAALATSGSETDLRGFEWFWLWQRAQGESTRVILAHTNDVSALAVSPDSRLVASAGEDGWVRVFERVSGRCLGTVRAYDPLENDPLDKGHRNFKAIYSVSFSPDGRFVACCSAPATRVWQVDQLPKLYAETKVRGRWGLFLKSGEIAISYQWPIITDPSSAAQANLIGFFDVHLQPVGEPWVVTNSTFCLSDDGNWLADSRHLDVHLWDLRTRQLVRTFHPETQVHRMALSPDGGLLALSYRSRDYVELWDPRAVRVVGTFQGHSIGVGQLVFSPDGRWLGTCGSDETIRLWDVEKRREVRRLHGHSLGAGQIVFAPDGEELVTGGADGDLRSWTVRAAPALPAMTNVVRPLAFSPDGRWLAAGYRQSGSSNVALAAWNLASHQPTFFTGGPPVALVFPRRGGTLVAATLPGNGEAPELWEHDAATGISKFRCRLDEVGAPVSSLALRPDGAELVSGHRDGSINWWDGLSGRKLAHRQAYSNWVETLRYSPGGRYLMSSTFSPRQIQTWANATRQSLATNNIPGPTLLSFAFAPDGRTCVTGGFGRDMRMWETTTFDLLEILPRQRSAVNLFAWSPDGRTLAAAGGEGKLSFWHVPTGRLLLTLLDFSGRDRRLTDVAFSPDGRWFAACEDTGELHLWHGPPEGVQD